MGVIESITIGDVVLDDERALPWDVILHPEPSLPLSRDRSLVHCKVDELALNWSIFQELEPEVEKVSTRMESKSIKIPRFSEVA